jgi:hypothetical protein
LSRHLLVIGAQRSGSTYLYSLLDAHPQITMARPVRPEPKVFLSDDVLTKGREWYVRTYFPQAGDQVLLGEKSTSYIEHPAAARRAAQVLGSVEVLAILRDPVVRAVSNWRFSTDNGYENRSLEQALRENLAGSRPWDGTSTSVSPFAYLERGRYADYLDDWMSVFGPRVHVLFLPELSSPGPAVQQLWDALGVDRDVELTPPGQPVNSSREPAPQLAPQLVDNLRTYYSDSDRRLAQRLHRELPWA